MWPNSTWYGDIHRQNHTINCPAIITGTTKSLSDISSNCTRTSVSALLNTQPCGFHKKIMGIMTTDPNVLANLLCLLVLLKLGGIIFRTWKKLPETIVTKQKKKYDSIKRFILHMYMHYCQVTEITRKAITACPPLLIHHVNLNIRCALVDLLVNPLANERQLRILARHVLHHRKSNAPNNHGEYL